MKTLQWLFDKEFLRKIGVLAIPIALQEVLTTALQFIDNIMVSYIDTAAKTDSGESIAIASVSFAGQNFFLFILLMVGITSGISIFTAQYWGDKDLKNTRKTAAISLLGSLGGALLFTIPTFFFADQFISFFSSDTNVITMGGSYLRIVTWVYLFTGITFSLSASLKSITDVKTPIFVAIFSVALNTVLNWILIFGKWGFPELGVNGAALATLISGIVGCITLIITMLIRKSPLVTTNIKEYLYYPSGFIPRMVKTTLPVIGNEMGWALGIFFYNKIFAILGTDSATAFSIAERVAFLFMVAFIGTSAATATLMGNTIGENSLEEAKENSKRILYLAGGSAILIGLICALSSPLWATHIFKVETKIMENIITTLIICTAITLPFKVINMHGVNGLMRSGGDTHFSMYVDIGCLWLIGAPLAILSAVVFDLEVYWVYLIIGIEEIIKSFIVIRRVTSGKWINRLVSEESQDDDEPPISEIVPEIS